MDVEKFLESIGELCPSLIIAKEKAFESISEFQRNPSKITATKVMFDLNVILDQIEKSPEFKKWMNSSDTEEYNTKVLEFLEERKKEYKLLKDVGSEDTIEKQK